MEDKAKISFEDFKKLDIRIGTIKSAEPIPDTDRLLKLTVDLGEKESRQIVSGIALFFPDTEELVGKQVAFAANLEPRTIRGHESNGMILAISKEDGTLSLLVPSGDVLPGSTVS